MCLISSDQTHRLLARGFLDGSFSFKGMLGAVDIEAQVTSDTETGPSSKANAVRLAVARAIACILPGDAGHNRLQAAGLLTQDDRFSERKKPGQKKARKKPIW